MRVGAIPILGRLLSFLPPSKRTVRMIFRQIGHGHSLQSGLITEEMLDWWLALLRYTDTSRNELDMGRGFFSPIRGFYRQVALTDDFLGKIQTPTYFLWGDRDPFGGIDTANHIVNLMPNADSNS